MLLENYGSGVLDLIYFLDQATLDLARERVSFNPAIQDLLSFLEVFESVVGGMAAAVQFCDLLD